MSRGNRCVPPQPGGIPRLTSGCAKRAFSDGEANIAGDSQFATAAECVPVDRGDDRLRQTLDGAGQRLPLAPECQSLGRSQIDHLLDIGARGERAIPGAGEDDDPDRAVLAERVERGAQEIELLGS